jgi:hypothetical protein
MGEEMNANRILVGKKFCYRLSNLQGHSAAGRIKETDYIIEI